MRSVFPVLLVAACLLASPRVWSAADPAAAFQEANRLYERQRYSEAAAAYEEILHTGHVSAALYFNLGNARFQEGKTGRAVAAYLQAERLAPRDPDIRANLRFAREQAGQGNPPPFPSRIGWLHRFSPDEWAAAASVWLWILFVSLAWGHWRPGAQKTVRRVAAAAGMLLLLCAAAFAGTAREKWLIRSVVTVTDEAVVRRGPFEESKSAFTLHDGAELRVQDQKNGWLQVADSSKRIGWLRENEVLHVP